MNVKNLVMLGGLGLGLVACGTDEASPNAEVTLVTRASSAMSTSAGARIGSGVELDEFKINIREIEFEFEEPEIEAETEAEEDSLENVYEDVKLKGPFEVSLLGEGGSAFSQQLVTTHVPNAVYEEIEFKLHKGEDESTPMYGKSVYASGTIDGKRFIFWHDTDEEFEIDFEDRNKNLQLNGQSLELIINFNLGLIFDSVNGVDISGAEDGNGDGTIEISPDDKDGNQDLADRLKDALEDATDLIDDYDND